MKRPPMARLCEPICYWTYDRARCQSSAGGPAWLFPNQHTPSNPVTPRSLNRAFHEAVRRAGIKKSVCLHTLGYCFACHLLEQNVDARVIQVLLGHKKPETTAVYTH